MADHVAVQLSTQERSPRSAVLRTVLAAVIGLFPLLNGILVAVIDALKPYELYLPGWVFIALNGTLIAATALAALVTRVLAVPGVNDWLRQHRILRWFTPGDTGPQLSSVGTLVVNIKTDSDPEATAQEAMKRINGLG